MKIIIAIMGMAATAAAADFEIGNYGADGAAAPAKNAAAVQAAIDAAAKDGGGRVVVPRGVWNCGTIWLKPRVELHLDEGAVLKASADLADYNRDDAYPENFGGGREGWNAKHFIIAHRADGASITGEGTIDGNGEAFFEEGVTPAHPESIAWIKGIRRAKDKVNLRPGQLVVFVRSRKVAVKGITIRNSPCWSLFFHGCEDVEVSDYTVRNGSCDLNTDGVDVDCCRRVTIERADIETGDDAIAIRASGARLAKSDGRGVEDAGVAARVKAEYPTEHIRIRDCRLSAYAMGIRIGVGQGVIRDVKIENTTVRHGAWGVSFDCWYGDPKVAGVDVEKVRIKNCRIMDCYENWRFRIGGARQSFGVRDVSFEDCEFHAQKYGAVAYDNDRKIAGFKLDDCEWTPLEKSDYAAKARLPTAIQP